MQRLVIVAAAVALSAATLVLSPGLAVAQMPPIAAAAKEWVPAQITPTKIPLNWSRATLNDRVTLDALGRRPLVNAGKRVWLLACERDTQLDCVESIGLVGAGGVYMPGTLLRGNTFDVTHRTSEGIRPFAEHHQIWDIPGLVVEGQAADVEIGMAMGGDEIHGFPGLNLRISLNGVDLSPSSPSDRLVGARM